MKNPLTHFDHRGEAHMIDVSKKRTTDRTAIAESKVSMLRSTLDLITDGKSRKGDVIGVARLAGIMAAKKTSDLIPLCHPLPIIKASLQFLPDFNSNFIEITATVKTIGKTGVEMEALTAVTVSALTIYDMLKSVDKNMTIMETRLTFKDGGNSGQFGNSKEL